MSLSLNFFYISFPSKHESFTNSVKYCLMLISNCFLIFQCIIANFVECYKYMVIIYVECRNFCYILKG